MCRSPSFPGYRFTKAPNAAVFTTLPSYFSPTVGTCGFAIASIKAFALSAAQPSVAPINTVPSSSIEIWAPDFS